MALRDQHVTLAHGGGAEHASGLDLEGGVCAEVGDGRVVGVVGDGLACVGDFHQSLPGVAPELVQAVWPETLL